MKKIVSLLLCLLPFASASNAQEEAFLSPGTVVVSADGRTAYTALTTARAVAVTNLEAGLTSHKITTRQNPNNVLLSYDGETLYVAGGEERGAVEVVRLKQKQYPLKTKTLVETGHTPCSMALAGNGEKLFVANRFSNTISVIDLNKNRIIADIPAVREPYCIAISPDNKIVAAGNFLPVQAATAEIVASQVTLIDAATNTVEAEIVLPSGSQSLAGIAFSTDGRWIYAVHLLSRFGVPITQIDKGWVNTNALSIIDSSTKSLYATVLLDDVSLGAANPSDVGVAKDGNLYIAIAGAHEVMRIDLAGLHNELAGIFSARAKEDEKIKEDLITSLSFTFPFKKRISIEGRLPLHLAFTDDAVIVSSRFSPFIEKISLLGTQKPVRIVLGEEPEPDSFRRGKLAFNDASICYQRWHSCASCHPDGRADGINWDQQNDGLGNPKNTKSLLFSHVTPPCMITGIRESAERAVRAGIYYTLNSVQPESIAEDMDFYLKNMPVLTSPYLNTGDKAALKRGKKQYEQAGCSTCHNGKYYTDLQKYDVGTGDGNDTGRQFDTPSLREAWRTAPYLYDGRAATLEEVFTKFNPEDRHGNTSHLNKKELEDLILYIKTL
jgi:YVTN family beta-propeller protein